MTNIIQFPRTNKTAILIEPKVAAPVSKPEKSGIGAALVKGIWVFTVLVWPLLKWIISIDCFFQLVRMMYYWNTPGMHVGWTFIAHFAVLTALTYFVSVYKPRRI